MGHEIRYLEYAENVDKKKVQDSADGCARVAGHQEGASGLIRPIRWIDHVCESRDDAHRYIESHNDGWYDQIAVKFKEYPKSMPSKAMVSLTDRLYKEVEKKDAYAKSHSVSSFKAEYIGCPSCGSKLKRSLLHGESCPLCGTELRSKTTMDTLKRYGDNIKNLSKQIAEEERKMNKKNEKEAKIKWLVKIEYHV